MNKWFQLGNFVKSSLKGITPKYIVESDTIVLNQKCIRDNKIDYSFSQFHDPHKAFNDKKVLRIGDLLFNSTGQGTAGRCAFVRDLPANKKVITDSHILIIRIDDYHLAECFSYSFYKEEKFIQSFMDGSTGQGELDKLRLFNVEFRLPEKNNRKLVCEFFNAIDQKIEINNQINQALEAMAKTLYDYWFVQFDFPNAYGKPYKSSGGKMSFNEELNREIPEGWEVNTISDWIGNDKSGDWGKPEAEGNYSEKVSCIRGADLNGLNGNGEVKAPERYILEKNTHKILELGDIIVEISGGSPVQSTGRMGFITQETLERFENPLICSNFCKAVTLKKDHLLYNFVYEWNRIYVAGILFGWEGKTSGIKNFLFESFVTNYKIVNPPKKLMELFTEKAKPVHAQIQKNLQQNQKLAALRDWLLPMLMNGQVRVRGKDEQIESEVKFGFAAEPPTPYGNESLLSNLFPTKDLYAEVACMLTIEKEMHRKSRGKTWVQKTANHLKVIKKEPKLKNVVFEENHWGMFSQTIAKAIDSNPFLTIDNVAGMKVYKVRSNKIAELNQWMQEPRNADFVAVARDIISLYDDPLINNDLDRIELLNTVYRCIQKLGTTDFELIYQAMREWPMQEQGYANKAEKFEPYVTKLMIKFIKDEILK